MTNAASENRAVPDAAVQPAADRTGFPTSIPAGGRVAGIGVDLVDVNRVRESLGKFPDRFVARVLSESERAYCLSRPDPAPHVAARFAAKEAVIKCLGGGCALNEIEVVRALSGSPSITLHGRALVRAAGREVLISLSHLDQLAAAFATLIERPMSEPTRGVQTPALGNAAPLPIEIQRDDLTLSAARREVAAALAAAGISAAECAIEARALILHATGWSAEALRLDPDKRLTAESTIRLRALTGRRARREPLAYVLGEREFYGMRLRVTPAVLIPRPETEFLVETALAHLHGRADARVADIGAGSGAIAIAVAAHAPGVTVWATDISTQALAVARANIEAQKLGGRIHLHHGDLLAPIADQAPFDAILSNPPYISPADIARLEPEVRDWEPCVALGTHEDPLHFYRRLAAEGPALLSPGGLLAVEVGQGQSDAVEILWRSAGLGNVKTTPDYAGIPRVVCGRSGQPA